MTRYVLDTNIVSNVTKPLASPPLLAWMAAQRDDDLFISALSIAEIRRGVLRLPAGHRRRALETWFTGPDGPQRLFEGRILPFDAEAALIWGRLMAEGSDMGRPRNALDMIIAAVAEANRCLTVTDNECDFAGLPMINPMRTDI